MTKKQRQVYIDRERAQHHRALEKLRAKDCDLSGLQLWRKLRQLETLTHAAATAYCNGENIRIVWPLFGPRDYDFGRDGCEAWEQLEKVARDCVRNIFGRIPEGVFFNADARGHCLKLDAAKVPAGMQTDWGRDGILAAEITR